MLATLKRLARETASYSDVIAAKDQLAPLGQWSGCYAVVLHILAYCSSRRHQIKPLCIRTETVNGVN